jgi:hypothetical protein
MAALVLAGPLIAGDTQSVTATATTLSMDFGEWHQAANGNVHIRGLKLVYIFEGSSPLISGRLTSVGDFNGDSDLNGVASGTSTLELGSWDFSSGEPVFIPSPEGGLFVDHWEIKGNASGPYTGKAVGHGLAGEVQGMQYNVQFQGSDTFTAYYGGLLLNPHSKK